MNQRYNDKIKEIEIWLNEEGGGRKNLLPWMTREIAADLQSAGKRSPNSHMSGLTTYFAYEATFASHNCPHLGDQWWSCYSDFGYWADRIHEARYYQWFAQYYQKSHSERVKEPSGTDPRLPVYNWEGLYLFWIAFGEELKVRRTLQGILKTPETGAFWVLRGI